jgi:hypothetical protein
MKLAADGNWAWRTLGSDAVKEVAKCVQYCQEALA